jgi:uncharacterized protein YfiM (DUF2279 family)
MPLDRAWDLPSSVPLTGQNARAIDDRIKSPYNMTSNLRIGREFKGGFHVEVAYISRQARRSLTGLDMMPATNLVGAASGMTYYQAAQILGRQAIANAPVDSVQKVPFWENPWSGAAGGGLTATQNICKQFVTAHGGYTTTLRNLDLFCTPACSTLGKSRCSRNNMLRCNGNYRGMEWTIPNASAREFKFDFNYTWSKSIGLSSSRETDGGSSIGNPWLRSQNKFAAVYVAIWVR